MFRARSKLALKCGMYSFLIRISSLLKRRGFSQYGLKKERLRGLSGAIWLHFMRNAIMGSGQRESYLYFPNK